MRTTGETSVYVLGGRAVSQVDKRARRRRDPGPGVLRRPQPSRSALGAEQATLAEAAVRAAATRLDADLPYARVDMMVWEDRWAVSELELIEPGLYLDIDPGQRGPFRDLVVSLV